MQDALHARWLIAVLGAAILLALFPFVSGLLGALVLAVAVRPVHERLASRIGERTAATITAAGALVLVLVPGVVLAGWIVSQAPEAVRTVAQSSLLRRMETLQVGGIRLAGVADAVTGAVVAWASQRAVLLVSSVTGALLNAVIALFGLYYLLIAGEAAWQTARALVPFSPATADRLAVRFRSTTESMLVGIVVTALAQGTVVGAAFAAVGLPDPAFWGFVTGCVSILPVLGSSLVWGPGALVLAFDHRYGAAVALGLIGVIVASNIDNVIRPMVYKRISHIHPMITLVGAFAGARIVGLSGLLLGPLAISYLVELVRAYALEYGASSGQEHARGHAL